MLKELPLYYCFSSRLILEKNYLACRTDDRPLRTTTEPALLYAAMSLKLRGLDNRQRDEDRGSLSVEAFCHMLMVDKAF
jgi:hypothetical protein